MDLTKHNTYSPPIGFLFGLFPIIPIFVNVFFRYTISQAEYGAIETSTQAREKTY